MTSDEDFASHLRARREAAAAQIEKAERAARLVTDASRCWSESYRAIVQQFGPPTVERRGDAPSYVLEWQQPPGVAAVAFDLGLAYSYFASDTQRDTVMRILGARREIIHAPRTQVGVVIVAGDLSCESLLPIEALARSRGDSAVKVMRGTAGTAQTQIFFRSTAATDWYGVTNKTSSRPVIVLEIP